MKFSWFKFVRQGKTTQIFNVVSCALLLQTVPRQHRNEPTPASCAPACVLSLQHPLVPEACPLDCEQSLFFSKFRGEERKQVSSRDRASMICEAASSKTPAILAARGIAARTSRSQITVTFARSLALRYSPRVFEEKRDRLQSACPQERADRKS